MNIKNKTTKTLDRKQIDKLLKIITKECGNKNWYWEIDSLDGKTYRSATIHVAKTISSSEITGLLNILICPDGSIKYGIEKTSFHSYGIAALFNAIDNALKSCGYLDPQKNDKKDHGPKEILIQIFKKFHVSVLQLAKRHDNRPPFTIQDEYDVQDYIHALLKVYFNDIRPEEHTPSHAGSTSRIDFLLKDEKILVEIKFATTKLKDKQIGEELILDMEKYKNHPDCEFLICFIYDPNFNIKNAYGLEKDLSGKKDKMDISIHIYPK